jgi:hypothetical protein
MAHFAEIDKNGFVLRVLVVDDSQEHRGQEFLANDLSLGGTWIQTSYNANIRGKFAGIGDKYDKKKDVFISPEIIEKVENPERLVLLEKLGITADEAKLLLG